MKQIEIAGRPIGKGHPCFVIGKAGVNHNGAVDLAREVDAAADAGVDAVTFQTYNSDQLVRPVGGIPPDQIDMVEGRRMRRARPAGTTIAWSDLD